MGAEDGVGVAGGASAVLVRMARAGREVETTESSAAASAARRDGRAAGGGGSCCALIVHKLVLRARRPGGGAGGGRGVEDEANIEGKVDPLCLFLRGVVARSQRHTTRPFSLSHPNPRAAHTTTMCGRAACLLNDADVAAVTGDAGARLPPGVQPRVNCAPSTTLPLVTAPAPGHLTITPAVWGLPSHGGGASPSPRLLINARSETAATTQTWARLLARGRTSRAVTLVHGWYEWSGAKKQPYFVYGCAPGGEGGDVKAEQEPRRLIALAALLDTTASPHPRFVILTTAPPPHLIWLHDRAPAVLGPASDAGERGSAVRA